MKRKIICALDTGDLSLAQEIVRNTCEYVGAYKIGHGLVLPYGLDVAEQLRKAGAERIFLDLKFHDIPNSVAIGVKEAAKHGVWMLTVHMSGGPAMIAAAVEEANEFGDNHPLLVGVSVLTSLDEQNLHRDLAVGRTMEEHIVALSKMGVELGLDGVVCSAESVAAVRREIGHAVIVTPGIRPPNIDAHDQKRIGEALQAISDGSDYLVIGRSLTSAKNPKDALAAMGLIEGHSVSL